MVNAVHLPTELHKSTLPYMFLCGMTILPGAKNV